MASPDARMPPTASSAASCRGATALAGGGATRLPCGGLERPHDAPRPEGEDERDAGEGHPAETDGGGRPERADLGHQVDRGRDAGRDPALEGADRGRARDDRHEEGEQRQRRPADELHGEADVDERDGEPDERPALGPPNHPPQREAAEGDLAADGGHAEDDRGGELRDAPPPERDHDHDGDQGRGVQDVGVAEEAADRRAGRRVWRPPAGDRLHGADRRRTPPSAPCPIGTTGVRLARRTLCSGAVAISAAGLRRTLESHR